MKISLINYYDTSGGAARAAYRIHHTLRDNSIDSKMIVAHASSDDWTVQGPSNTWTKIISRGRLFIGGLFNKLLYTDNPNLHSASLLPSSWSNYLNDSDTDVVHLHWVNGEMMSIKDIGLIRKPVVWTIHDMWAFSGAEHYTNDFRWKEGYKKNNRPLYESGLDLNRWVWKRKLKCWKQPIHIVCPSNWLAECARKSVLMRDWPITVIPNPINTELWNPVDKTLARELLHLPIDVPLLLFGALGGESDPRKGFDLLRDALQDLHNEPDGLQLVVFGQSAPREPSHLGFPIHYVGMLHDDVSLRLLYSAADVMVVPSRQEAFGQTASEAHSCGTPVVAFDGTGLSDIVIHKENGYLARPFDIKDLAIGIQWVLGDDKRHLILCKNARQNAIARFSYPVVFKQYLNVYKESIFSSDN